jgi:hypothetical protein
MEEIGKKRSQLIGAQSIVGRVNTFGCGDKIF